MVGTDFSIFLYIFIFNLYNNDITAKHNQGEVSLKPNKVEV